VADTASLMLEHLSSGTYALIFIAIAYIVSLVRDWRPIRTLRDENKELRRELNKLQAKYADLEKKYDELGKSRDFQAAFEPIIRSIDQARDAASHEHKDLHAAFVQHEQREAQAWSEITRGLAANTSVLAALAAGINAGTLAEPQSSS
jgi:biopolymer transport protein ExbB/TolQ